MVGPPKTLYDLRKVEASVRVTCRVCGAVKLHDLEELIHSRLFRRESVDWSIVQRELPCPKCDTYPYDVHVAGVPFGRNDQDLRARRGRMLLMNLALAVLHDAAQRVRKEDVCTPALRLALRVLRPYLPERRLLLDFWTECEAPKDRAYNHAHLALRGMVNQLLEQDFSVWAQFR